MYLERFMPIPSLFHSVIVLQIASFYWCVSKLEDGSLEACLKIIYTVCFDSALKNIYILVVSVVGLRKLPIAH